MITRIAQISDTHLSPSRPFFSGNFDLAAEHLRAAKPDMVINTGDLALDGADSEEDLREALALHQALGLETYLLPGNHDVGDHLDVARKQPVTAERLARYRNIIGPDSWTVDAPGWRFVGLNALIIGANLPGEARQEEMLRHAAKTLGGRSLALFLHKPLADEAYAEQLTSNRFMTHQPRRALLDSLQGVVPAAVMCGHVHQYRDTHMEGARHIWGPATSFVISDPWQPGYGAKAVGYLMHEFGADGSHSHRLVGVRGLVHHDLVAFPDAYGDVTRWGEGNA
jgi:3',5'-cyclic-AMP phosphodiesterase